MIERLMEHPLFQEATRVAAVFGGYPDQVLDCDRTRYEMRVAGALVLMRDREAQTPNG